MGMQALVLAPWPWHSSFVPGPSAALHHLEAEMGERETEGIGGSMAAGKAPTTDILLKSSVTLTQTWVVPAHSLKVAGHWVKHLKQ